MLLLVLQAACFYLVVYIEANIVIWFPIITLVLTFTLVFFLKSFLYPITRIVDALSNGAYRFMDNDFSMTIHNEGYKELEEVIQTYNQLATNLREQRVHYQQREQMLNKVVQVNPVAMILTNKNDTVVHSNIAAKTLLGVHGKLEGRKFSLLIEGMPAVLLDATINKREGLITDQSANETVVYHLHCQTFSLNNTAHYLYLYKNMTTEMSRKETEMWRKAIRLISHELNNSLAPTTSLIKSANKILFDEDAWENHRKLLPEILETIARRTQRLHDFTSRYANFARLPAAKKVKVDIAKFLQDITNLYPINLFSEYAINELVFDPGQIEQVLINLIKNAIESGSPQDQISLHVKQNGSLLRFSVRDGGPGMTSEQLSQAILPFYTTKTQGTGFGLPLCNEIISNHGGRLRLSNRETVGFEASFNIPINIASS